MIKCLITGCWLYSRSREMKVWGDLHQMGAAYIFNAVLDQDGEADWDFEELPVESKALIMVGDYFERRGVIVVSAQAAFLNDEALEYLE